MTQPGDRVTMESEGLRVATSAKSFAEPGRRRDRKSAADRPRQLGQMAEVIERPTVTAPWPPHHKRTRPSG